MNSENQNSLAGGADDNPRVPPVSDEDTSSVVLAESVESIDSLDSLNSADSDKADDSSRLSLPPLGVGGYLSWMVVLAITLFITITTAMQQFGEREPRDTMVSDLMQINLQAKVLVGQRVLEKSLQQGQDKETQDAAEEVVNSPAEAMEDASASEKEAEAQAEEPTTDKSKSGKPTSSTEPVALDTGTYEQRLCYAILLSELYGPQRAVDYLETLDEKVADADFEPNKIQQNLRASVETLVVDYVGDDFSQNSISESDKTQLKEKLGFSGELLLTPKGTKDEAGRKWLEHVAESKIYTAGVILISGILFFLGGIVAACTILGVVLGDSSPARFMTKNDVGGIYIQTFAIWLVGFFGAQFALPPALEAIGIVLDAKLGIFLNVGVFFLSLCALAWPIIRGRSWSDVCHDIGWSGESFFKNVGIGIATYAAWLPMMLVGIFSVFVLMLLFPMSAETGGFELPASPSHPVQHLMASGDTMIWIGVFLAACVAAPIVEETMFRGVLYRHLRERGFTWNRAVGVAVAALINGVIFAAIHPQGLLAIPLLATLAIGFTLAREWRDSLVSSITMHALNNSMVTAMMFFLL